MGVLRVHEHELHELHGASFRSYVRPATGSTQLCAWRLEVQPGTSGTAHRVSHEEVLLVLDGTLRVHLDGGTRDAVAGDVVHVPAGAGLAVDNVSAEPASAWVTTSVGLVAELTDGTWLSPPWVG